MKAIKIVIAGCAVAATCALSMLFVQMETAKADLRTELGQTFESCGLGSSSVQISGTHDLEVTIRCGFGQEGEAVWIRALLEEELNRLKYDGKTDAESVKIVIQNQEGHTLLTTTQPIEATSPAAAADVSPADVEQLLYHTRHEAQRESVGVSSLEVASNGADLVASIAFTVGNGEQRERQLEFVVRQLLPKVRQQAEQELLMPIVFYRLSMLSEEGNPLVNYVVNASKGSVRAWMAEGVDPVWAYGVAAADGSE